MYTIKEKIVLKQIMLLLILLLFNLNHDIFPQTIYPSSYDKKVVIVPEGQSRSFMFTNKKGLFYYGETGQPNKSQYQGLSYLTYKFLEDYIIEISGITLSRSQAESHILGDKMIRFFKNLSVEEEIAMVDSLPILSIKLRTKQKTPMAIAPLIAGFHQEQDFIVDWSASDKILYIAQKHHLVRNNESNYPVWIGICTYPEGEFTTTELENSKIKSRSLKEKVFYPGKINVYLESEIIILFILGDSKNEVLKSRNNMLRCLNIEIKKQNQQIEGVRQARSFSNYSFALRY